MTTCLCIAAHGNLRGQTDSVHSGRDLSVFVGASEGERLDVTASPSRFGGHGVTGGGEYSSALTDHVALALSFDGDVRSFTTGAASSLATERLSGGDVRGVLTRSLAHSAFAFGISMTTSVAITMHQYADPTARAEDFLFGYSMLGPAATWGTPIAGGSALLQVTSPVAGLVDHPYSDSHGSYSLSGTRFATASTFRGVDGSATYTPDERRHVGFFYTYHFSLLRYADVQPLSSASQSLSIGVITRLGPVVQ
jgi:hypothetical protein